VLQKIAAKQKIDVLATTTYRLELLPTYYTGQPPPKISGSAAGSHSPT
jgi:hypothetical protein